MIIKHRYEDDLLTMYHFMLINGSGYAQLYIYKDKPNHAILSSLSVTCEFRKKGLGTRLQITIEELAKSLNIEECYLWVEKGSWMQNWYERRGYVYDSEYGDNDIWMKKALN
jgi:N-acetylglutamate synthase-like GNAT family acetyltransferase